VWAKLDDEIVDNLKTLRVWSQDPAAFGLDCRAIAWSARQLTDGFVPREIVATWIPEEAERERLVGILIEAGRWDEQDGYVIHDFLEFNFSRAEVEAERAAKSKGGTKGGKRSGEVRRRHARERREREAEGAA